VCPSSTLAEPLESPYRPRDIDEHLLGETNVPNWNNNRGLGVRSLGRHRVSHNSVNAKRKST
jgi:hypothetical protein